MAPKRKEEGRKKEGRRKEEGRKKEERIFRIFTNSNNQQKIRSFNGASHEKNKQSITTTEAVTTDDATTDDETTEAETTTEAGNNNRSWKPQQKRETTTEAGNNNRKRNNNRSWNKQKTRTSAHHWAEFKNIFEPFASFDRSGGDAAD